MRPALTKPPMTITSTIAPPATVTGSAQHTDSPPNLEHGKVTVMTQLITPTQAPTSPGRTSGSLGNQGIRFFLVGSAGTILQLGLYAAAAHLIGAQVASVACWLASTLVTNTAHRALTFGVRGNQRNRTDQLVAFLSCLVGLLITSLVLAKLPDADGSSGIIAILAINTAVGAARFVVVRWWLSPAGQRFGSQVGSVVQTIRESRPGHSWVPGLHH